MKKRLCGNCKNLYKARPRIKYAKDGKIQPPLKLWACGHRWWTFNPLNEKPCEDHAYRHDYENDLK